MSQNNFASYRKIYPAILITAVILGFCLVLIPTRAAPNATFVVDTPTDSNDSAYQQCTGAASDCSLRGAITKANALAGDDIITLPAGTYTLTITGSGEHNNATGDLDITSSITSSITINGAGASSTIIQAGTDSTNGVDRVFHVVSSSDELTLNNVTIRYGLANGGGVYNVGTLTINNSIISNNTGSTKGGGVYHTSGTLTIENSTISDNVSANGGGMYIYSGGVTIRNSSITSNDATDIGGGGMYINGGTVTIETSTISDNSGDLGGGANNFRGALTIENSTISNNSAGTHGGGIYSQYTLNLTHCTITGNNSSSSNGGGIKITTGPANSQNSIVVGNNGPNFNTSDCSGGLTSQGYNLVGAGTGCPSSGTGDQTTSDPKLGPLQDNGGPTFTHALGYDSPAVEVIPAGINGCGTHYTSDQRGETRPQGLRCDVGAYESAYSYVFWDGGGADNNTSTAENWSDDTAPTTDDTAVFNHHSSKDATVDSDLTLGGWWITSGYGGAISQGSSDMTVDGDWLQTGGTFNGGSGWLNLSGAFDFSGGTFSAPSGLMSIGGGFHHNGGSFDPNGGRVVLDNTADQTLEETTFNDLVINDGLLGYWELDEDAGTNAVDSSGYGYDGTLYNSPTWSTNTPSLHFSNPGSLSFDQVDGDYVDIPGTTEIDNMQQLSLSTWVNLASTPSTNPGWSIMRFISLGNEKAVLRYADIDGTPYVHFYMSFGEGTLYQVLEEFTWTTSTWYHVAGTYDGSTMRLYVDGVEQGTKVITGTVDIGDGIRLSKSGGQMDGQMDDVRVYNRAP